MLFLMRKDILESLSLHFMNDTKPKFADLARHYNCDYSTVKRYYKLRQVQTLEEASRHRVPPSLIENFKAKINEKIDLGCPARISSKNKAMKAHTWPSDAM